MKDKTKVIIKLSKEESLHVANRLKNPPEPNKALRELMSPGIQPHLKIVLPYK